jgi:hypothetical protein
MGIMSSAAAMPENSPGVIVAKNHPNFSFRIPTASSRSFWHSGHSGRTRLRRL